MKLSARMHLQLLAVACLTCVGASVFNVSAVRAQSLSWFGIDATQFPLMAAKMYAFDNSGNRITPQPSQLVLQENGITRQVLSINCPPATSRRISAVLTIDASGSMSSSASGNVSNMEVAKGAARVFISALAATQSECAITSFDDRNYLLQDFTTNVGLLENAVTSIVPMSGTNYDKGLFDTAAGALKISRRGKYQRVVVFLTDGQSSISDEAAIINEARRQRCIVYVVTIGMQCPTALRTISEQTGGTWFENIRTASQAEHTYRAILAQATGIEPCDITWQASPCLDGMRSLSLTFGSASDSTTYQSPDGSSARLEVTPSTVFFLSKTLGFSYDTTIAITAVNSSFNVIDISSTNPLYSIAPRTFALAKGETKNLTITYTPSDSVYTWTTFNIQTDVCNGVTYASAGYRGKPPITPLLKIVAPNGGEQFVVGTKTMITWSGIPATDTVKLDYSIDAANTWLSIVDRTSGGKYIWLVPNTPSTNCVVRVRRLQNGVTDESGPVHTLNAATEWVRPARWSPDGTLVATVGDTPMLKIWDALSGKVIHDLPTPAHQLQAVEWSPEGTRVAVSGLRGETLDSGYLAIWNALSGQRIHDLPEKLYSPILAWNKDGTMLAASGEGRIWQAVNGVLLATLRNHAINPIITWNPNNTQLASAGYPGAVVWDLAARDTLFDLSGRADGGYWVRWNKSGDRIATASLDSTVQLWDGITGAYITTSSKVGERVYKFEWSPEGRRILGVNASKCATVWDGETLAELLTLDCGGYLWSAAWSNDGRMIATGAWQHHVTVWDAQTGARIHEFVGHSGSITGVEFSPDDRFLLSSATDGTAKIWRLDDIPAMVDSSDAVFSIVRPDPIAQNIDMGRVLVGGTKDSVVVGFVKNTGTFPYAIDSITIVNISTNVFGVVSGIGPYTIRPSENANTEFRFAPNAVGPSTADIVVNTTAGTIVRTITGEGVLPSIEVQSVLIDFGKVVLGTVKPLMQIATIKNVSDAAVSITNVRHAGPNTINFASSSIGQSFTLQPGGEVHLSNMSFAPTVVGRTSGSMAFEFDGIGSPAIVQLFGEGINDPALESAVGTIRVGDGHAKMGDTVNISITLVSDSNLQNTSATSLMGQLRFNATLLEPLSPLAPGSIRDNDRVVNVVMPLPPDSNGVLATMQFRAALGNDSVTALELENVEAVGGSVEITTESGLFKLDGICYAGGARLINPDGTITLSDAAPNPIVNNYTVVSIVSIESGVTSLTLRDMMGRVVKTFFENELPPGVCTHTLDVGSVAAGAYMLVLRTPTEQRTIRIEIAQ